MSRLTDAEDFGLPAKQRRQRAVLVSMLGLALAGLSSGPLATAAAAADTITFNLARSAAAVSANCLTGARASVSIHSLGAVEEMTVVTQKLPPNTDFDLFVIQLPNAPFGLSWYQGDIETNSNGLGVGVFIGRFSNETFIVAPGTGAAPVLHSGDESTNPETGPVHTFRVGLWFNSPTDAAKAGCPNTETPFNGDHTAGVQALSTRGFADDQGPLRKIGL